MNIIILFGPPGVGKGTQADLLAQKLSYLHLSTGNLLRQEVTKQSPLGKQVDGIMKSGRLVTDDIIFKLVEKFLHESKQAKGCILDGFPRRLSQAEHLKKMFLKLHLPLPQIVNLTADNEELTKRILKRAKLEGRADDNAETIKQRLTVYQQETAPLIEFYKDSKHGILKNVNGMGSVEEIQKKIVNSISH